MISIQWVVRNTGSGVRSWGYVPSKVHLTDNYFHGGGGYVKGTTLCGRRIGKHALRTVPHPGDAVCRTCEKREGP